MPAPENRIHGLPLCRPSVLAFGRRLGHLIEATELTPQITTDGQITSGDCNAKLQGYAAAKPCENECQHVISDQICHMRVDTCGPSVDHLWTICKVSESCAPSKHTW